MRLRIISHTGSKLDLCSEENEMEPDLSIRRHTPSADLIEISDVLVIYPPFWQSLRSSHVTIRLQRLYRRFECEQAMKPFQYYQGDQIKDCPQGCNQMD